MGFSSKVDVKRWERATVMFPSLLLHEMGPAMDRLRLDFQGRMVLNRLSGPRPSRLGARSGATRRSFASMRTGTTLKDLGVRWYFSRAVAPHSKHLEAPPAESVISPVKATMLAIPLDAAKAQNNKYGAIRDEYSTRKGQTLRSLPGIFMIYVRKSDKRFLVKRVGGELKFLFVLKAHVTVRRRLGFKAYLRNQSKRLYGFLEKGLTRAEKAFKARKR